MNAWDELESTLKTSTHPAFADNLLAGALESDDLLGAYGRMADIVAALQTPAFERELSRRDETVAEMARILGAQARRGRSFGRRGAAVIAAAATMSTSVAWASGVPVLAQKAAVRGFQGVEAVVAAAAAKVVPSADVQTAASAPPPAAGRVAARALDPEKLVALESILDVDGATYREEEPDPPAPPAEVPAPVVEVPAVLVVASTPPSAPPQPPAAPEPRDDAVVVVDAEPTDVEEPAELEPGTLNPEAFGDEVELDRKGRPVPKPKDDDSDPTDPAQPDNPGNKPEDPGKPGDPSNKPDDPGKPGDPGNKPDDPGKPGDPGNKPDDPGKPDEPGNRPEDPGQPDDPGRPGNKPDDPGPPEDDPGSGGAAGDPGNGNDTDKEKNEKKDKDPE